MDGVVSRDDCCGALQRLTFIHQGRKDRKKLLTFSETLMSDNLCDEFLQYGNFSSKAEKALHPSYVANCVFNAFSSYTAIMLNSLTIYAINKTSSLPKPLKTLLLSLAVSDLGVGLLVQPMFIVLLAAYGGLSCSTRTASFIVIWFFSNASFLNIFAISVDRFLAVHLHLRYQELVTHKRVVAVVISIWLSSAVLSVIDLWVTSIVYTILIAIFWGCCFISTAFVYCRIYVAVRRHTNQIQALQVQQAAQNGEMENAMRLRKSAVSTFFVYLVFLVCHLPDYCIYIASLTYEQNTTLEGIELYTDTLALLNSSLNPVIYCWKMRHIRHTIIDILRNVFH